MKAITQEEYGSPDVLEFTEVPDPAVGDGDVLIRVHAASVHPGDFLLLTGVPYLVRLAFGLRKPRNPVPGRDVAGTVERVGSKVKDLRVGDKVFGWSTKGTLAEYVSAPESQFVLVPSNVTMEEAAVVPVSATTALKALRDVGKVQPGQKVLIIGASGGIGTFAVQMAKSLGAHVTGVCSTKNLDMVRSIGADEVIDYTRDDFTEGAERYDFILDNVGGRSLSSLRKLLTAKGTLIPNNGTSGGRVIGTTGGILKAHLMSVFVGQNLKPFLSKENKDDLVALAALLESGAVKPVIDRTYPLVDSAEAFRHVGDGHVRGKVVITV